MKDRTSFSFENIIEDLRSKVNETTNDVKKEEKKIEEKEKTNVSTLS